MVSLVLAELRAATSGEHTALEDVVAIERRIATPGGYESLLPPFFGFYQPLEAILAHHPWTEELNFESRKKSAWLAEDLQEAGHDFSKVRLCEDLPSVGGMGHAWGCLYVLEGSTLGGQHISRMLDQRGVKVDTSHFFRSYGTEVSSKWKSFLGLLDALPPKTTLTRKWSQVRWTLL